MWIAKLSNEEEIKETPMVAGQKSAWQELLQYCKSNNLKIKSLVLETDGIVIEALPNQVAYFYAKEMMQSLYTNTIIEKQGIGIVIDGKVYITWVNSANTHITQDIRQLNKVRIHTNA